MSGIGNLGMARPWTWRSPDSRLADIKYARDLEEERSARLDELDNQRLLNLQAQMETEQARAADLDRRDAVQEEMRFEQVRSAELDRRDRERPPTPPVSEWMPQRDEAAALGRFTERPAYQAGMQRFREVEQRQQPPNLPRRVYPDGGRGPMITSELQAREVSLGGGTPTWAVDRPSGIAQHLLDSKIRALMESGLSPGEAVKEAQADPILSPEQREEAAELYYKTGQAERQAAPDEFYFQEDVAKQYALITTGEKSIGATAMEPMLPESVYEFLEEKTGPFGPSLRREAEFFTSPVGVASAVAFPGISAKAAIGGVGLGGTARALGAPEDVELAAQLAGNVGGAVMPGRALTGPVRAGWNRITRPPAAVKPMTEADVLGTRFADVAEQARAVDIPAGARGTPGELRTMVEEAATYGTRPRPVSGAAGGFPQADVVVGGALTRLTNIIKQTKPLRAEAEEFKSEAMRRKAAALRDVQADRGGEAGFYAGRGTLRSPNLPTPAGEAVRGQFSQREIDALVNHPLSHPAATARPLEAANAQAALLDTLSGKLPTKGQIGLLEQYFGTEFAQAVRSNRSLGPKAWETLVDLYHVPRTVMASIDNSFPLRQGVMTMARHPKEWFGNLPESFRSGFSPKRAQLMDDAMRTDATVIQTQLGPRTVSELAEEGGLFRARIEGVVMSEREEFFQSNLAKRIPILGAGVRWSERAYVTYGNKLRHDIFKNTLLSWQGPRGGVVQITSKKVTALANLINRMTGRGTLGPLNQYGPELAAGFFAPKFAVSRPQAFLQLFNWQNPEVARMAASEIVSFVALGTSILSLIKLSGAADVQLDPRSADFGKIKLGNTRIDFWGGNVQWARLVTQLQQGKRMTADGIVVDSSKIDNALRFLRYKAHPSPGTGVDLLLGETAIGEKFPPTGAAQIAEAVFERIAPMAIQDLVEAIQEHGTHGFLFGAPAFGGVGVQTYETKQEAFTRVTGQKWSETPRFRRDELIRANPELQRFEGGEPTTSEEIREDRGAELLLLAPAVLAGTPGAAHNYHENRQAIMTRFAGVSENEFGDMDIPVVGKDMELLEQYYSVDFLSDWDGNGILGDDEDTRMALEQQDKYFQQLSPDIQDAMKNPANFFPQAEVQAVEERRNDALEKLRHLFDEIPKYSKETVEGSEKIDDYVRYVRQQHDDGIHEYGKERWGWTLPNLALELGAEDGKRDLGQAASWVLSRKIKWNDEYNDYLIEHQEVIAPFFPKMYQRTLFREPGVLGDEIWAEVNVPMESPAAPSEREEAMARFREVEQRQQPLAR